jgi:hypothetical protein
MVMATFRQVPWSQQGGSADAESMIVGLGGYSPNPSRAHWSFDGAQG